jgi:hypothetical protein
MKLPWGLNWFDVAIAAAVIVIGAIVLIFGS